MIKKRDPKESMNARLRRNMKRIFSLGGHGLPFLTFTFRKNCLYLITCLFNEVSAFK